MINSTDYVYSLFLSGSYYTESTLKILYKQDPVKFKKWLLYLFNIPFQNEIFKMVGIEDKVSYGQEDVIKLNNILYNLFNKTKSSIGTDFFEKRNITMEEQEKYKLGDTITTFTDPLYFKQLIYEAGNQNINEELLKKVIDFHFSLFDISKNLYGNGSYVTIPSFDREGNCSGICYRSVAYKNLGGSKKNVFKFHFLNAPAYLYGEEFIDTNDELYCFEGVFDVIACRRIGIENCLALGNVRLSEQQYEKVKDKKIHYRFDDDLGGRNGLRQITTMYKKHNNENYTVDILPFKEDIDEHIYKEIE